MQLIRKPVDIRQITAGELDVPVLWGSSWLSMPFVRGHIHIEGPIDAINQTENYLRGSAHVAAAAAKFATEKGREGGKLTPSIYI